MVGLDYVINLLDKNFTGGMAAAKRQTQGLDDAVGKTNESTRGLESASKKGFGSIKTMALAAAAATALVFGVNEAINFGDEVTKVASKMEAYSNAIVFASGNDGANNIQFLDDTIKNLNLDMETSYKGFQNLTGSLKGTKLEGEATRDIFEAIGFASAGMRFNNKKSEDTFSEFSKMAAKGKLSAEDFSGQLNDNIPGALKIAADSMGMNQVAFNKMLSSGQVYAEDFLPKFSKHLKKTFEGDLPTAANSMEAAVNKKNNALLNFQLSAAKYIEPGIKKLLQFKTKFFNFMTDLLPKLRPIWESIKNIGAALSPLTDLFMQAGTAMGGTQGILDGLKVALDAVAIVVEILANGIGFLWDTFGPLIKIMGVAIGLQWALNVAMTANPIGLIIVGIAALAGGLIYAYEKVGWFRASIVGTWAALKEFGTLIKTMVIDRITQMLSGITGIGSSLLSFFKGDWQKAWDTGTEAIKNLTGVGVGNGDKLKDGLRKVAIAGAQGYVQGLKEADLNNELVDVTKGSKNRVTPYKSVFEDSKLKSDKDKTKILSGSANGSGRASKNITFKIESLVKTLNVNTQSVKEGAVDIERQLKDIFIRMIKDVEINTANQF